MSVRNGWLYGFLFMISTTIRVSINGSKTDVKKCYKRKKDIMPARRNYGNSYLVCDEMCNMNNVI